MADDCGALVRRILDMRKSRTRRDGVPATTVVQRLVELPSACRPELRATAAYLLGALPDADEGALNVVLEALTEMGDPAATELVSKALQSRNTMLKEDYVSMLEDLEGVEEAIAGLTSVLVEGESDPLRPDLVVTIRALHALRLEQMVPRVATYVSNSDPSVRGTSAAFVYDFDDGNIGGPLFADRLTEEADPRVLETLIDGLVRWNSLPDESILRRYADDPSQPSGLRQSARRAIGYLQDDAGS